MADAKRIPTPSMPACRLVAIDGSTFELPDEADNAAHFGYPGSRTAMPATRRRDAWCWWSAPRMRSWAPTWGPTAAASGSCASRSCPGCEPGMLCMADRGFNGFEHWQQAQATGAQLLWRCVGNRQLPVHRMLDDGSYLSAIYPTGVSRSEAAAQAIVVRVIEYALPGLADAQPRYRLLTTLLDPLQVASALELAALYHQRWEIEERI